MNSKLKVLLSVVAMSFVMVGCGSSGSSDGGSSGANNSAIAAGQNELGYYGQNVIFGNLCICRGWEITSPGESQSLNLLFPYDNQYAVASKGINVFDVTYGISNDGTTMKINDYDNTFQIHITSSQSQYCYNGTFSNISTGESIDVTICGAE